MGPVSLFFFLLVAGHAQTGPDPSRDRAGVPWTGSPGVQERLSDIMARQHQFDLQAKKPEKFKLKKERENPERDHLRQDKNSPNAARWVPSQSITDSQQNPVTVLAPQKTTRGHI
jgi:hypothetical protein